LLSPSKELTNASFSFLGKCFIFSGDGVRVMNANFPPIYWFYYLDFSY